MTPDTSIKPCPFCGGKAQFIKRDKSYDEDHIRWSYKCRECHIWLAFNYPTRKEAIKAWNRRTP